MEADKTADYCRFSGLRFDFDLKKEELQIQKKTKSTQGIQQEQKKGIHCSHCLLVINMLTQCKERIKSVGATALIQFLGGAAEHDTG